MHLSCSIPENLSKTLLDLSKFHLFLKLFPLFLKLSLCPHLQKRALRKTLPPFLTPPISLTQLICTYTPSALSLLPPQFQPSTSPLTQSLSSLLNCLSILLWNANGIRPRRIKLLQFFSLNQYDRLCAGVTPLFRLYFSCTRLLNPKKGPLCGKEWNHHLCGKPRRWCLYFCQKWSDVLSSLYPTPVLAYSLLRLFGYNSKNKRGLSYTPFYLYVPPIRSSCSKLAPASLSFKTCPSKVFSLLHSISDFSSSSPSSDLPNFPNYHTPVDYANQLSAHLQFFSFFFFRLFPLITSSHSV